MREKKLTAKEVNELFSKMEGYLKNVALEMYNKFKHTGYSFEDILGDLYNFFVRIAFEYFRYDEKEVEREMKEKNLNFMDVILEKFKSYFRNSLKSWKSFMIDKILKQTKEEPILEEKEYPYEPKEFEDIHMKFFAWFYNLPENLQKALNIIINEWEKQKSKKIWKKVEEETGLKRDEVRKYLISDNFFLDLLKKYREKKKRSSILFI